MHPHTRRLLARNRLRKRFERLERGARGAPEPAVIEPARKPPGLVAGWFRWAAVNSLSYVLVFGCGYLLARLTA